MRRIIFCVALFSALTALLLFIGTGSKQREVIIFLESVQGGSSVEEYPAHDACQFKKHDVAIVEKLVIENKAYGYYLVKCSADKKTYIPIDERIAHTKIWL